MSASGAAEKLLTVQGQIELMRDYLAFDGRHLAPRLRIWTHKAHETLPPNSWVCDPRTVSTAPVVWLKNRLVEDGAFWSGPPSEIEDRPILFQPGGRRRRAKICPVARSKFWDTLRKYEVVEPINLQTLRVAGVRPSG
jgi:hypothetical protein